MRQNTNGNSHVGGQVGRGAQNWHRIEVPNGAQFCVECNQTIDKHAHRNTKLVDSLELSFSTLGANNWSVKISSYAHSKKPSLKICLNCRSTLCEKVFEQNQLIGIFLNDFLVVAMITSVPETTEGSKTKARCLQNHSVRCNETWHVRCSTCKRYRFHSSRSTNARSNTAKVSTKIRCTTLPPPFPSDARGCRVLVHRPPVGSGCSTVNTRSHSSTSHGSRSPSHSWNISRARRCCMDATNTHGVN